MTKFDFEHFDYETAYREVCENYKKPNIFLCGQTGAGKSSLINDIFDLPPDMRAAVSGVRPHTMGIHEYAPADGGVVLIDTEGYELGKDADFEKNILGEIDRRMQEAPLEMEKHIHCAWYCINAGQKRFLDKDREIIEGIKARGVPVMVVLTKIDTVGEDELNDLRAEIRNSCPGTPCFTYTVMADELGWDEETKRQFVQKEEMIEWARTHLPDHLQNNFMLAVKTEIRQRRKHCMDNIVLPHALMATAAVTGTSLMVVPFTDSVPLMGIQIKMVMSILKEYGIQAKISDVLKDLTGSALVSYVGRTLASEIIGIIPFAGQFAKSVVNVSVATSITAVLGAAVSYICESYLQYCVDNGGAPENGFLSYFDGNRIKDAMNYVGDHKKEFYIDEMMDKVKKKGS